MNWLRYPFFLLVFCGCFAQAQTPPDTLMAFDTVGIAQRRTLFTPDFYTFRAARQLTGPQVVSVLLRSSDLTVLRLALRAKRRYTLPTPLIFGSYGLLLGGVRASRNQPVPTALGGTLILGSFAMITTGLVAGLTAPAQMRRAVRFHNQMVTNSANAYALAPRRYAPDDFALTTADTVAVRRTFWGTRYTYRGLDLLPDLQLEQAMRSVRDPQITEGLRQNKILRAVGGVVGGFSAAYLATRLVTGLLVQAAGFCTAGRATPLTYVALGGLAVTFGLGRISDRTTRQVVRQYNNRLAQPPPSGNVPEP